MTTTKENEMTIHYLPLNETHYTVRNLEDSLKYGTIRASLDESHVDCVECLSNMDKEGVA